MSINVIDGIGGTPERNTTGYISNLLSRDANSGVTHTYVSRSDMREKGDKVRVPRWAWAKVWNRPIGFGYGNTPHETSKDWTLILDYNKPVNPDIKSLISKPAKINDVDAINWMNSGGTTSPAGYDEPRIQPNIDHAVQGGPNWDLYCQMGDNIFKNECQTIGTPPARISKTGKNNAMRRVCNTLAGDKIAANLTANSSNPPLLNSKCRDWCETNDCSRGGSGKGVTGKFGYCGDPNNWPEAAEFCKKDIWGREFNKESAENSCGNMLIDGLSDQNIFTDNGCGILCQSQGIADEANKDVNHEWCNNKYGEFCSRDKFNMFTDDCKNFCERHPQKCETALESMCSPINTIGREFSPTQPLTDEEYHTIQAKMNQYIPGTTNKWSDWCGCYQGDQFYDKWRSIEYKKWRDQGIDPEIVLPQISEKCTYPWCKPSIKTYNQTQEPDCPECVQLRFDDWSDAIVKDSVIDTGQELGCGQVAQDILREINDEGIGNEEKELNERETSELKGENSIVIDWISDNFDLSTEEGQINVGIIVAIIIGSLIILGLVGRLVYVKIKYGKISLRTPK